MASSVCPLPSPGLGSSFVHFEKFGDRSARRAQRRGMGVRRGSSVSRFMQGPWECPPSLEGCPKGQDTATGDGRPEPSGSASSVPAGRPEFPAVHRFGLPAGPLHCGLPAEPPVRDPQDSTRLGLPCIFSTVWSSLWLAHQLRAPRGNPTRSGLAENPTHSRGPADSHPLW